MLNKIRVFFLILVTGLFGCEVEDVVNKECIATTHYCHSSENEEKVVSEYYNEDGYIYRAEKFYVNLNITDYETYKYDDQDRILEYNHSSTGNIIYEYNAQGIVKEEIRTKNNLLARYYVYGYDDKEIIKCERYLGEASAGSGLDTAYLSFYSGGMLDSVKIKSLNTNSDHPEYNELKSVYKYDEIGNLLEHSFYDNFFDDEITRLRGRYIYSYNSENLLTNLKLLSLDNNFETDEYERFFYDEYGNIIATKVFDRDDNLINVYETNYQGNNKMKLIKPKL